MSCDQMNRVTTHSMYMTNCMFGMDHGPEGGGGAHQQGHERKQMREGGRGERREEGKEKRVPDTGACLCSDRLSDS